MIRLPTMRRVVIAVFLIALWLPLLAFWVGPERNVSDWEKRKLAAFPEARLAGESLRRYTEALEDFYNDHFGFRETLIRWYNYLQVKGLGVTTSPWVVVGTDGWLFQGGDPHLREMRNAWAYGPGQLDHWVRVLSAKHQWLSERGIVYLFVIAPNKHTVYGEYLPTSINRVWHRSRADQLLEHLRAHTKVPVLDLREPVRKAAAKLRTHHKTDTHWNAYGAYIGYRAIITAFARTHPNIAPLHLTPDDFEIRWTTGGDLAQTLNMQDVFPEAAVEPRQPVRKCAVDVTLESGADDRVRNQQAFATECAGAPYRLLMFRDSYALAMMPFLSETFGYAYYVPASPVPLAGLQRLVDEHDPDIVIEQRANRWLRSPEG